MIFSVDTLQKQSEEASQRTTIARAQSDKDLLLHITGQLNTLVSASGNRDQITKLQEDKARLEERIRVNESILAEVCNGKDSAEKREKSLRADGDKLVEELARLRDVALTTKKGTSPATDFQILLMKWTKAHSLLAESRKSLEGKDRKLQSQEERIRTLSDQLSQAEMECQKSVEEMHTLSKQHAEAAHTANQEERRLVSGVSTVGFLD
jgi:hypothetical protein